MKGDKTTILKFLRNDARFSIPVYQRDYSWGKEQCRQLYDDLISMIITRRSNHFFGSIVDAENPSGWKQDYIIIDGQQRITTITILVLAFRAIVNADLMSCGDASKEHILKKIERVINTDEDEVKLTPAPNCKDAFFAILKGNSDDFILDSPITTNYNYFYNRLLEDREIYTADQIWNAIDNLIIIDIYLEENDDAQLIFESINSTGLALSESDKTRNYLMMSLEIKEQERYYNEYWKKIESNTEGKTDFFIRDFLTIHTRNVVNRELIYEAFKTYARNMDNEQIIKSMLKFSKYWHMFYYPEDAPIEFRKVFTNLNILDVSVANTYIMQLFEGYDADLIPEGEVLRSLEIIEDYIFRRNIVNIPSNALNKIFLTLYIDALKLKGNIDKYSERISYVLMKKEGSGRFPRNTEFLPALRNRDIYTTLSERKKLYLLERLENYDNNESHDIYALSKNGKCSIEHILPQTLNDRWRHDLGEMADDIQERWVHKLANLTFTGYNSKYSNRPFAEKRTMEHGFCDSTFFLNKFIASKTKWGEEELKEREEILLERAEKIWPEPHTIFEENVVDDSGVVNLAENYSFTGKQIKGFTFEQVSYSVNSWKDFLILFAQILYEKDKSILEKLAHTTSSYGVAQFITASEHDYKLGQVSEVKPGIFIWTSSSTNVKLKLVKNLLDCYNLPYTTVEISVRNLNDNSVDMNELSFRFWTQLLPHLNEKTRLFSSRSPRRSSVLASSSPIIHRMRYRILFNSNHCVVGFEFNTHDKEKNLKYFDLIYMQRKLIEESFGEELDWIRNDNNKISLVQCYDTNCELTKESSWDAAIAFICEKLPRFYNAFQPIFEQYVIPEGEKTDEENHLS